MKLKTCIWIPLNKLNYILQIKIICLKPFKYGRIRGEFNARNADDELHRIFARFRTGYFNLEVEDRKVLIEFDDKILWQYLKNILYCQLKNWNMAYFKQYICS